MGFETDQVATRSDAPMRYEILKALGEGAAGQVFLARDLATGELLALKRLRRVDSKTVLRLKREFRALADVDHPNIVRLYDLERDEDGFALIMEYVGGVDLGTYLSADTEAEAWHNGLAGVFHELAAGVQALHDAGILHRDLKPSNVLVASDRVVLLDFGLVRPLGDNAARITMDGVVAGTPAYMAPEQASGKSLGPASDWYAVGVMLYEAICGTLPFDCQDIVELMALKAHVDPEPPPADSGAPEGLRQLCFALLSRDPSKRPHGPTVVAALAELAARPHDPEPGRSDTEVPARIESSLVGRQAELSRLRAAFVQAQSEPIVVHLRGNSGAGKSALLERFLDELRAAEATGKPRLVLHGRCYERESMPFKALDGVVDALVRHLATLDELEVAHALPVELSALAQVFPVFERNATIRKLLGETAPRGDATQTRERAELALRDLLRHLGSRTLPVVAIDDLHWGDVDSAQVLEDWLKRPPEPLLLILSYRSEEAETSSALQVILEAPRPRPAPAARELWVDVPPLSDDEVRALCLARDEADNAMPNDMVASIVQEARGNPFLAQQLTALAHARLARGERGQAELSLAGLVTQAGDLLPAPAMALLEVLAIAGRPLASRLALSAAGIQQSGRKHIHRLQRLNLLRMRDVGEERRLEIYHDRLRDAVGRALSAGRRAQIQRGLLREAERHATVEVDWLHSLAVGAGEPVPALKYGRTAADNATASLAFERAAELYESCLAVCEDPEDSAELWASLAAARARCRDGVRAAEAYVNATTNMSAEQAAPLLRLAASHFIRSGRFEEGDLLVRKVLRVQQLDVPTSQAGLMAAVAWEIGRQSLRGDHFEVSDDASSEMARQHCHLYGTLAIETLIYAPLRAFLFQARALRFAHLGGDAALLAHTLCVSATMACVSGTPRAARRSEALLRRAAELVARLPRHSPQCEFELRWASTISSMMLGRPRDVIQASRETRAIYESNPGLGEHGEYYYMFAVHAARMGALANLGMYQAVEEELPAILEVARTSDNWGAMLLLTLPLTMAEQMMDLCVHTRKRLERERQKLPGADFSVLHLQHLLATLRAACITGDFAWATPIVEGDWPRYLGSQVSRGAYMAYVAHTMHARFVLNRYALTGEGDPARLIAKDLRRLARLPQSAFTRASLCRHRARLAHFQGDRDRAMALLGRSVKGFTEAEFRDECEFDRYALGVLMGGEDGRAIMHASLAALGELGCRDPIGNLRGYYPELVT